MNSIEPNRSLADWVNYIQTLHFREIELSLDRVRQVYQRLYPSGAPYKIITVAGTNGKGSTAAILSSILHSAGFHVGKFTSPHLVDFSERYQIDGQDVTEQALLNAMQKVERARADIPITFFEFGALLAIDLFAQAKVDVAVMEVGLGGRLDAINILDADVAVITSLAIDHTSWLGDTIDKIGFEKAGIARLNKPCVVGISQPPASIIKHCADIGAELIYHGAHFQFEHVAGQQHWVWSAGSDAYSNLPLPFAQSGVQLCNAATALMALRAMSDQLPVSASAVRHGLSNATVLARCQLIQDDPKIVLDVAHNEASVLRLAEFVRNQRCRGKIVAIVGMLQDKEIGPSLRHLSSLVDGWTFATIDGERGASAEYVQAQLSPYRVKEPLFDDLFFDRVESAFDAILPTLKRDDLLLVFGSFYIAGDILRHLRALGLVS